MEILIVSTTALFASMLTLFSGFGLGTLLMPVVAIFFPIEMAVAITATVHLSNNLFKGALFGRRANLSVLIGFGVPAIFSALVGAFILGWLSGMPPVFEYVVVNKHFAVLPVKLTVGIIILIFVTLELLPVFSAITIERKYLPYGGTVSGFFGGLSGHQGAFRSMFLLKAGLSKEEFVANGVLVAVMVDIARLIVYGWDFSAQSTLIEWPLVIMATLAAFLGAYIGARLIKKITIKTIQSLVSALLVIIAIGLMVGIV